MSGVHLVRTAAPQYDIKKIKLLLPCILWKKNFRPNWPKAYQAFEMIDFFLPGYRNIAVSLLAYFAPANSQIWKQSNCVYFETSKDFSCCASGYSLCVKYRAEKVSTSKE